MKKKSIFVFIFVSILVSACATIEPVTEEDILRAKEFDTTITLDQLRNGQQVYMRKCGSCHYLYSPSKLALTEWKQEINEMRTKAKLTAEDEKLILYYLSARAKLEDYSSRRH